MTAKKNQIIRFGNNIFDKFFQSLTMTQDSFVQTVSIARGVQTMLNQQ